MKHFVQPVGGLSQMCMKIRVHYADGREYEPDVYENPSRETSRVQKQQKNGRIKGALSSRFLSSKYTKCYINVPIATTYFR